MTPVYTLNVPVNKSIDVVFVSFLSFLLQAHKILFGLAIIILIFMMVCKVFGLGPVFLVWVCNQLVCFVIFGFGVCNSLFGTCLIFLLHGFQYILGLYLNILDLVCSVFELESARIVWHSSYIFNLWVFKISCMDVQYTTPM